MRCICSYSTQDRLALYSITNYNKQKYASKFQLVFEFTVLSAAYKLHPAWYKLDYILQLFDKYDEICFIDDDASFVKFDVNIFDICDLSAEVNIAKVNNTINTGVFIIRKTTNTIAALQYAQTLYEQYQNDALFEQTALITSFNKYNVNMQLLDATIFNSSIYTRTEQTLILHLMGKLKYICGIDFIHSAFTC